MELKVKLLRPTSKPPSRANPSDAGLDLYADIDAPIRIPSQGSAVIPTGVAVAIPEGFYGRVASKSGLSVKSRAEVGAGVIDAGYRGEIKVLLYNHVPNNLGTFLRMGGDAVMHETIEIQPGQKIAQLIIERIALPNVVVVYELDETDRNENGFGSTGI